MNKYLLYICTVAFFCLACAEEVQEDDLFIESILSETNIEPRQIDVDTTGDATKELNEINTHKMASKSNGADGINSIKKTILNQQNSTQSVSKPLDVKIKEADKTNALVTEGYTSNNTLNESEKKNNNQLKPLLKQDVKSQLSNRAPKSSKFDTIRLDEVLLLKRLIKAKANTIFNDNKVIGNSEKQITSRNKPNALYNNPAKQLDQEQINTTSAKESASNKKAKLAVENMPSSSKTANNAEDSATLNDELSKTPKGTFKTPVSGNNDVIEKKQTIQKSGNEAVNKPSNIKNDNEKSSYRILYDERKITKLFTDPSEHSKTYKAPKVIEIKKGQVNYQGKNGLKDSRSKNAAKEVVVNQPEPKNNENDVNLNSNRFNNNGRTAIAKVNTKDPIKEVSNKQALVQNNGGAIAFNQFNRTIKNNSSNEQLTVKILNKKNAYKTNTSYTLITQITNNEEDLEDVYVETNFPKEWKVISISAINGLKTNERKLCLISFYIPTQVEPGEIETFLTIKSNYYTIKEHGFTLKVEANYDLEVFNLTSPKQVQAGELIESTFGIKNNGNTSQEISLGTRNTLIGDNTIIVTKDSTVVVTVSQKTDRKANNVRRISTNLEVLNTITKKKYYNSSTTEVIPSSIKQKDPYFRYPIEASLYYNSFTKKDYHYSTLSAELRGNGFLDLNKEHHLDFIIRGPNQQNLRRFSVADQYSLIYRYKDSTTLYLGDHAYDINRLGYDNRYGMGFRIDHNIKKWTLSAFYSKPRLFDFNNKPLYGVKAVYHKSDSLKIGIAFEKSEGNVYSYQHIINQDGKGQIATLDYYYRNNNTYVDAEMSASFNSNSLDYASRLNFTQRFNNISFNSNLTYAGKNYLGTISNSLQLSTGLSYYKNRFNFGLGHAVSRVNRRLDPILFEVEPYFENFFATLGYRFGSKHNVSFRFDKRIREDQLDPINYKYQEYGFDYRFNYRDKLFTGSFGGRFAKTQNLLIGDQDYRNTYTHDLNVSYRIFNNFSVRGALNHILTNRYGYSGLVQNYYRYNFGFNYNVSRVFRINANYNSGFSPEENYRKRDFINLNLNARINQRHRFEVRANYFENPAVINNKELQAFAKYTYSFGVGMERLFDQGGIEGFVSTNSQDINIKGIKMYIAGKTVVTDKYGNFELNNLEIGTNYIYLDESSLPVGIVLSQKNPIKVIVEKDKRILVNVLLVKAGNVLGNLNLTNNDKAIETNLESYVKLENDEFTYYAEADENGRFRFKNIVPGDYTFTLMRFKNNGNQFREVKSATITVSEGVNTPLNINVKGKERKIRFKNNNLKVAYNED